MHMIFMEANIKKLLIDLDKRSLKYSNILCLFMVRRILYRCQFSLNYLQIYALPDRFGAVSAEK